MFTRFIQYIEDHEDWLMGQVLTYARKQEYTRYTSTLKEPWRLSVSGLSEILVKTVQDRGADLELSPDEDFTRDPAAQFGMTEARRHRERGISMGMFLGLMKYYSQSYRDLIAQSDFSPSDKQTFTNMIIRFFDRVEIAFCCTWNRSQANELIDELQVRNRQMTNEKNKYLTIFESLSMPVLIVDRAGKIENINHAGASLFNDNAIPGSTYYGADGEPLSLVTVFAWLADIYQDFIKGNELQKKYEKAFDARNQYFNISFSRSLDLSGKFSGTIVIMEDITNRKLIEQELERRATTDPLTGVNNRRAFLDLFEQELTRFQRHGHDVALMMMDIDHFKRINDAHGHDTGDRVLKLLAAKSFEILRASDRFGRWGGEEFIILLPETDLLQASAAAERLKNGLSRLSLPIVSGAPVKFTVSIGLTMVNDKNILLNDIVKRADQALYLAKQQGRNRVVLL